MADAQAFVPSMDPMPEPDLDEVERRMGITFKDR